MEDQSILPNILPGSIIQDTPSGTYYYIVARLNGMPYGVEMRPFQYTEDLTILHPLSSDETEK